MFKATGRCCGLPWRGRRSGTAFDARLIADMTEAFAKVEDERAVILTGDGSTFSSGGDLEWMRSSIDLTPEENFADALRLRAMFDAVDDCPAPIVVAVQGHAIGAACGVITCCDAVIAHPSTRSCAFGEVKRRDRSRRDLSVCPGPHKVVPVCRRLFVTGERFDAETALPHPGSSTNWRALTSTLHVDRVVSELLSAGPNAVRAAKQIARTELSAEESAQLIADLRTGAEGQEGLRAFLERRKPSWLD